MSTDRAGQPYQIVGGGFRPTGPVGPTKSWVVDFGRLGRLALQGHQAGCDGCVVTACVGPQFRSPSAPMRRRLVTLIALFIVGFVLPMSGASMRVCLCATGVANTSSCCGSESNCCEEGPSEAPCGCSTDGEAPSCWVSLEVLPAAEMIPPVASLPPLIATDCFEWADAQEILSAGPLVKMRFYSPPMRLSGPPLFLVKQSLQV